MVINKKHTLQNGWTEAIRNERIASKEICYSKIWVVNLDQFGKRVIKLLDYIIIGFI